MNKRKITYWGLMFMWVTLCAHTMVSYWTHESAWIDSEVYTIFFLKMSALTFPIGMVIVTVGEFVIAGLVTIGLDFSAYFNQQITIIFIWLTMTLTGLIQWFFVTPRLFNFFLSKRIAK